MNILKKFIFWALVALIGVVFVFGPMLLVILEVINSNTARFITLYIGAPIFIPSAIAMMIASKFEKSAR